MNISLFKHLGRFAAFLLVQVLVLNHIHLFNCATPLLYIYMAFLFPRNYPKWAVILWCFCLGLGVDVFSNTSGVASASMTLAGAMTPYLLEFFLQRESAEDLKPSLKSLGIGRFAFFAFIIVFSYNLVFYTLETFTFFNWQQWLLNIGGSTVLTLILIIVLDNLRDR